MITCIHCNKVFNYNSCLEKHLYRKFPCYGDKPINNPNDSKGVNVYTNRVAIDQKKSINNPHHSNEVNDDTNRVVIDQNKQCPKCDHVFKRNIDCKSHMAKCTGCHSLQCPICLKTFTSAAGKSRHKKNVTCGHNTYEHNKPISMTYNDNRKINYNTNNRNEYDGYLYIIQTREFKGQPIYKIGRSADVLKRIKQYPKGSELLSLMICSQTVKAETELIALCCQRFIQRREFGKEYFEGNLYEIKEAVDSVAIKYNHSNGQI